MLITGPVPGILQSAFRAELFGVLQALKYTWYWKKKIRIWSDCQSVVSRLLQMLYTHKAPAVNSNHADLWFDIYELLECLHFQDAVIVTKVAAHQDVDTVFNAAEQWAFVHNALADRTARLANLQRTNVFWALHREHARAVEFASFVSTTVQDVILNISRKVVLHESTCREIPVEDLQTQHVAPIMSVKAPRWDGFSPKFPLPLKCTAKYGHRFVATVTSWFQQAISEAKHAESSWVSIHQLFLDYQFQTGELGPIRDRTWIDTAQQSRFRLKPHPFKKRSGWFGRSLKEILRSHDCSPVFAVTRPDSEMLALHVPSLAIIWPRWRLLIVEDWLAKNLPHRQAATRNGSHLAHLPPAKQDGRWPDISVVLGPIGS